MIHLQLSFLGPSIKRKELEKYTTTWGHLLPSIKILDVSKGFPHGLKIMNTMIFKWSKVTSNK